MCRQTFIFPYVLEGECEARVLSLDDADLTEGALAYDAQQAEVIEVHCEGGGWVSQRVRRVQKGGRD